MTGIAEIRNPGSEIRERNTELAVRTSRGGVRAGFTIVELLVVVSIIALLVGILLPAVAKARDKALIARSQSNLRNLSAAAHAYAADWNDRQFTLTPDNLARFGGTPIAARNAWLNVYGGGSQNLINFPLMELGLTPPNTIWFTGQARVMLPFYFEGDHKGFGWFRFTNAGQFNDYVSGRFYDAVFYPPKDEAATNTLQGCLDAPGEVADCVTGGDFTENSEYYPAGYCFSPAALISPDVLAADAGNFDYFDGSQPASLRCPGMSQAIYPELKSHIFEHHWLQHTAKECNPNFEDGIWDGCEPYYFNHAYSSQPVTLFYDGHIELLGQREAVQANQLVAGQDPLGIGTWNPNAMDNGYFHNQAFDNFSESSHNILTTDGIRGRDKLAR